MVSKVYYFLDDFRAGRISGIVVRGDWLLAGSGKHAEQVETMAEMAQVTKSKGILSSRSNLQSKSLGKYPLG